MSDALWERLVGERLVMERIVYGQQSQYRNCKWFRGFCAVHRLVKRALSEAWNDSKSGKGGKGGKGKRKRDAVVSVDAWPLGLDKHMEKLVAIAEQTFVDARSLIQDGHLLSVALIVYSLSARVATTAQALLDAHNSLTSTAGVRIERASLPSTTVAPSVHIGSFDHVRSPHPTDSPKAQTALAVLESLSRDSTPNPKRRKTLRPKDRKDRKDREVGKGDWEKTGKKRKKGKKRDKEEDRGLMDIFAMVGTKKKGKDQLKGKVEGRAEGKVEGKMEGKVDGKVEGKGKGKDKKKKKKKKKEKKKDKATLARAQTEIDALFGL